MKVFGGLGKVAAAIAVAMALTACTTEPANHVDPRPNPDEMAVKWAQCMRENGANVPDPDPNVGGRGEPAQRPPEKLAKAQEQCKQYAGSEGQKTTDPAETDRQAKYDQCLRDHGIVVREDPGGAKVVEETDEDSTRPGGASWSATCSVPVVGVSAGDQEIRELSGLTSSEVDERSRG